MPYPSQTVNYNFNDPACYSGSGTTVYDLAGLADLVFQGTPTWTVDPYFGNYFSFTAATAAADHLVTFSGFPTLAGSYDFSYAFVIRPKSYIGGANECYGGIFSPSNNYQYAVNFGKVSPSSQWTYVGDNQSFPSGFTQNNWYVVVITVDQTNNTMKVYLNGVLSTTLSPLVQNPFSFVNPKIQLGYFNLQSANPGTSDIKAFSMWKNAVLTPSQVLEYTQEFANLLYVPVMDLNASESASASGSGATWYDLTANNYDFAMSNPSLTSPSGTNPGYCTFPARSFTDPLTVYGEYNGTPAITTQSSWTNYVWVKRNVNHTSYTQNRLSVFANGREDLSGPDNGWSIGTYNNPNAANDNVVIEASGVGVKDSGYGMGEDCWVNLCYIYSAGTITIYENGVLLNSQAFSYTTPADGMWISRTAGSYFSWIGDISIIRQFDFALTGTQLLNLIQYDKNNYIPQPTVIASWDASDSTSYSGSGNTWYDLTGNNIDLLGASSFTYTAKNTTPNPLGWTNPGYFTNATTNRMVSIASNYLQFSTTGTIQGWFYNNNSYGVPVSFPYNGNFPSYWFQAYANKPGFNFLVDNTFRNWNPGGSVYNLQWFNWAVVFNNGIADLYINGVYVSSNDQSAFGSGIFYNPANLSLVIGDIDNSGASYPFVGNLGEIKIYSTALTAGDILQNYNDTLYKYDGNAAPPGPPKLISYDISDPLSYSGTGNTVYDLTANNNDIQLYNSPTLGGSGQAKYLTFNGSTQYAVGFGFTGLTSGDVFTRNYWLQLNSTANIQWASSLGYYYSPSFAVSEDYISNTGQWQPNYGANVNQINDGILPTGQWINLTYVSNGSLLQAYVNGGIAGTYSGSSKYVTPSDFGMCIGGYIDKYGANPVWNNAYLFNGNFAVYEVYDGALTSAEVGSLYSSYATRFATPPQPYQGLVGGRTFSQGFAG